MMWLSSLLMLVAFTSVMGQRDEIRTTINQCETGLNELDHEKLLDASTREQMEAVCPVILQLFTCVDNALQEELSISLEEVADLAGESDEDVAQFLKMVVSVKNVFTELCTEGTPLNQDFKEDIDCFDTFEWEDLGCQDKVPAALEVYREISNELEGEEDDDESDDVNDRHCVEMALGAACITSGVHEKCGERSFNTINTILKRTTFFSNMICSKEKLEELQSTVIDRLDMSEAEKVLFKLGLDLKRRRK